MSRDGSGNYSLPQAAFTAGTTIESAKVNSNFSDIASALTASLAKDGQTTPTANLPMGSFKHTGVANATARTHYAAAGQVADNSLNYAVDTGTADAYAIAPAPGITAYAVGQRFTFKVINANATTTPTLAVNGLTAGTIKWPDGSALLVGDLPASALVEVVVADTTPTFHLQTVSAVGLRVGRNVLINGDFSIDQRNAGASKTLTAGAAVAYCVDRWYASCTGANVTVQQVAGTSPNPYAIKFTGLASNTGVLLGQRVEAANSAHLTSQTVYVSLQVKSSSLTSLTWTAYYANSADDFSSKTQIATGTISSVSSTLAAKSFSFNAGASAANGIAIEFTGGALLGTQTLQIENVQLDTVQATTFERLSRQEQLARCKRYCLRRQATAVSKLNLPGFGYTNNLVQYWIDRFDTEMRSAPTFSISAAGDFQLLSGNTTLAATSLTLAVADVWGAALSTANTSYAVVYPGLLQSANSSAWMQYEAEL